MRLHRPADLVVELGCVIRVSREIEDKVLCRVSAVQEGPDLIDAVGMGRVIVGE